MIPVVGEVSTLSEDLPWSFKTHLQNAVFC